MQIKKYLAATLREATQQMKDELGSDAIILSTRIIEGDPNFGTKKMFELTAGTEDVVDNSQINTPPDNVHEAVPPKSFAEELNKLSKKIYNTGGEIPKRKPKDFFESEEQNNSSGSIDDRIEAELKEIAETLTLREVQKPIINSIISQLKKYKNFLHTSTLDNYVISSLASMIPTYNFELSKRNKAKVISVVGPTGVGKTTCIAKLAVISKILHNLNVGLISIDTYRLGAIDQLRIFSEISNIDLLVAYEPKEMPHLVDSFKKKDIIFIDTAGRSQKNIEHLNKTKAFLDAVKVDETYLVLSATSTTKNLLDVAEKFSLYNYNSLMFTKIDEAVAFGNMLNVVTQFNVPVTFLANGQIIPDDIISADSEFIANMVYTGKFLK